MKSDTLLQQINHRDGTRFAVQARFMGGEQGAFAITDPSGEPFVLKGRPRKGGKVTVTYARGPALPMEREA